MSFCVDAVNYFLRGEYQSFAKETQEKFWTTFQGTSSKFEDYYKGFFMGLFTEGMFGCF